MNILYLQNLFYNTLGEVPFQQLREVPYVCFITLIFLKLIIKNTLLVLQCFTMFTLHYLKPSSDYLNTYQYLIKLQFLMWSFYKIWLLSLILVHVLKGWFVKTILKTNKKNPFEITSAFSFLKLLIKWNVDLGCGRFMGFVFY